MIARPDAIMAQRRGAKRAAVTRTASVPAPVGGLNARDSIAAMKPTDALVLDNYVPGSSNVALRKGYKPWATGLGGAVESLLPYRDPRGNRMFAAAAGSIFDVTASGAVGAAVVSGLSNTRFQWVNFGTPGGHFLIAVNGADAMRRFDGATWSDGTAAPAVTGFDTTLAIAVNVYGERLWFVERNSFRVWYMPLQSIGGAASSIDMSSLFKLGGSLVSMLTWTIAGETDSTQYACFVSSEGEIVIFTGDDPSNADTWSRAGTARVGRPVGQRFATRVGTDVVMVTADGFVPLSQALQVDRKSNVQAVSNKIVDAANQAFQEYGSNYGWQIVLYPVGNKLIVNVPTSNGTSIQYVMNTNTNAWCSYSNIPATCFETMDDALIFGGAGTVYQAEVGNDDNGAAIVGTIVPAFNYFGSQGVNKRFTQVRVIAEAPAAFSVTIDFLTNFDQLSQLSTPSLITGDGGAPWNTTAWDSAAWGVGNRVASAWQWAGGIGFCGTARILSSTKSQRGSRLRSTR